MKLYREDGEKAYSLVKEARENGKQVYDDYNETDSDYVTQIYETKTHKYTIVINIDYGVLYSVEKVEI